MCLCSPFLYSSYVLFESLELVFHLYTALYRSKYIYIYLLFIDKKKCILSQAKNHLKEKAIKTQPLCYYDFIYIYSKKIPSSSL